MTSPILVPTPIQRVPCEEAESRGVALYVKRDDLLPYAFGGNKVRIALEFVEDMEARGFDALVMYGDVRSNLCRVLAFLCRESSVPCAMVASSADGGAAPSFNERLVRRLGVEVFECGGGGVAEAVDAAMGALSARGLRPYYIYGDRTGTGNEGTAANAYARAYEEISRQERELGIELSRVFVPYGTGCTQGGLVCGSLLAGDDREVVGISISSRPPERALGVLDATIRGWHARAGLPLPEGYRDHVHLELGYTCGGYGARDARVDELIERMLLEASLPLDPTYTGKALRGALDYLSDNDIRNTNVLFVHTGGTPLFYDYLDSVRAGA